MAYARIENIKDNSQPLDDFTNSAEFQLLLGEMGWDDAIDRYEDMPEYDKTLYMRLSEELRADIASGRVQIPTGKGGSSRKPSVPKIAKSQDDSNLPTLERLKKGSFTFDDSE
jgi:hypothetical protein